MTRAVLLVLALAACPHRDPPAQTVEPVIKKDAEPALAEAGSGSAVAVAPAPPLPDVPLGLPPVTLPAFVTPEAVARGAQLFVDPTMSLSGKLACASCHDPKRGFASEPDPTANNPAGVRRGVPMVNLAWRPDAANLPSMLQTHGEMMLGILGEPKLAERATTTALAAYALTRYAGDSPWDRAERAGHAPEALAAGYKLFMGKAQCGLCHTPPLYTDFRPHQLGDARHIYRTPTLRDAGLHAALFHDASASTIEDAIDKHGVEEASKSPKLSTAERDELAAFVRALSKAP